MDENEQNTNYEPNQIIADYINRYSVGGFEKPTWPNFFTQLNLTDYHQILPYIFGLEIFNLRILKAYLNNETICIYSDYDTDAVTATATMYHGLIELGFNENNISFYAPDRFTEGYGMNTEAIKDLCQKYDLIVSVDCGINSREEASLIQNLKFKIEHLENENNNIKASTGSENLPLDQITEDYLNIQDKVTLKIADLIITDHHQLVGTIPEALGVINPRLNSIYSNDPELLNNLRFKIEKEKLNLFSWLSKNTNNINLQNLDVNLLQEKIQGWLEKVEHNPKNFDIKSPSFLTPSATGVGVAWFCLVWLAYFMEEVGV